MLGAVTASLLNTGTAPDLRRSSLLYGIATLWLLLWTMVATVEFARYLHGPGGPTWRLFVAILIEPVIAGAWLAWMIAARKFESPSIDPPREWFRYHLRRRLPWLALVFAPIVWGLRWSFYWLIGTNYGVTWNHAWSSRLRSTALASFRTDDYKGAGITRSDDTTSLGIKVDYYFRRWLRLGAGYTHWDRNSNPPGFDYKRNIYMFTVGATL